MRKQIRKIAQTRVRYGYRRIHVLLRRKGWRINAKRVYRLYKLERLQMRHKPPRRRVMAKLRADRQPVRAPHEFWSMDWMCDELLDGRRIWVLTIVDNFSCVSPAIWVATDPCHRCGGHFKSSHCRVWMPRENPSGQWQPVHLQRTRSVGLCQRGHLGLLPTRKAQCLYRSIQQSLSIGVPQPTLVSGPTGRHNENKCLAAGLQSGPAPWSHRQSGTDGFAETDPSAMADGS